MEKVTATRPGRKSVADYKAEVAAQLAELDEVQARMDARRPEIEDLREQNRVAHEEIRAILSSLGAKL
jgi:hypothetical protein